MTASLSRKPHIALFINSMRKGGAERVMANLAEYLYTRGWQVTMVTTWFDPPEYVLPHAGWDHETGKMTDTSGKLIRRVYAEPAPERVQGSRLQNFRVRYHTIRDIWLMEKPDLILSFIGMTNIMALLTVDCPILLRPFVQEGRERPPKNGGREVKAESQRKSAGSVGSINTAAPDIRGKSDSLAALDIPVVVSVRSTRSLEYDTKKLRFLADHVYPRAAGVVFQTAQTRDAFPLSIRKKAVVLPNSVNPAFMQPRYGGTRDKVIVSVGRLDENKNQAMLISAFARVKEDFPAYQLQLYGDGPAKAQQVELARAAGLRVLDLTVRETGKRDAADADAEDRTIHLTALQAVNGKQSHDSSGTEMADVVFEGTVADIPARIRKASVYVLCSNIEGMPNSLIEAMSLGLACISTDCEGGGPASLIESGLNGYLVPPGDIHALTSKLRYLLSHDEEIDRIGRNAAKVQEDYNPDKINAQWEAYLLSKLDGGFRQ